MYVFFFLSRYFGVVGGFASPHVLPLSKKMHASIVPDNHITTACMLMWVMKCKINQ